MPRRVLLIDDDGKARDLAAAFLESAGYEVCCATSGLNGLALADTNQPDVVVLDLQMPRMDGYEVCRILRQGPRTRQIPIVMLTVSDDPLLNQKAYAVGAQACVPKPFRRESLIAALGTALAGAPREKPPGGL